MIRFQGVGKEYPRTGIALSHITFHVRKGEFAFLTGPSGSGKSTILKLAYMEEKPSHGDVRVSGLSARGASRREIAKLRRKLGIVFQDFRLLEDRSAEANVAFALEVTDTPKAAIQPKVHRVLAQVGLASKATSFPRELSGGEQQRVAIARALSNKPHLLLADEPTGNLDSRTSAEIMSLLKELNERDGKTIIMVTHDPALAKQYAHRTVTMLDGAIVSDEK